MCWSPNSKYICIGGDSSRLLIYQFDNTGG